MSVNHKPRLCHVTRGPKGYGFHLHGEKGKYGQFIRKVESDTPAELSGLKAGDRVVEVNGDNVENFSHQEVVAKIKEKPDETFLLVVDDIADQYFQENDIAITKDLVQNGHLASLSVDNNNENLRPRLCHLQRGPQGFGFNLHSDKSRKGRYIRTVESGGQAAIGGLRAGDRVIEVNGVNMEYERHQNVVAMIKDSGQEVKLLVVHEEADKFFKSCGVTPSSLHLSGPLPTPLENPAVISPSDPPAPPASTPSNADPSTLSQGIDLMTVDLDTLKKLSRPAKKKSAPSSNWNNRQAIFNNL